MVDQCAKRDERLSLTKDAIDAISDLPERRLEIFDYPCLAILSRSTQPPAQRNYALLLDQFVEFVECCFCCWSISRVSLSHPVY